MSASEVLLTTTYPAAGDLSSSQYYFVKLNSSGQVAACGDGQAAIGVLQNDPAAAGRACTVAKFGKTKVVASAAIAAGAEVASTATGTAVTAASSDVVLGFATEAATVANQIIVVDLSPTYKKA